MISKPVQAHSFYHTCRYIVNKPGAEVLLTEGVRGRDYKAMAADFEMQQQLRPGKTLACFHSILSFYPGELPSDELMKEISRKYLAALGIVNTQYAVCKHTDKKHLHLHLVANLVNNEGKTISDSWMGLRGKKIAQQLTQEYNLVPAIKKNVSQTNTEALSQADVTKYNIYNAITETLPGCKSLEELEQKLLVLGIETLYKYKGQSQEKQGVSFRMGNICFKGSQVDRKFSLAVLHKTIELHQKMQLEQRQPDSQQKQSRDAIDSTQKTSLEHASSNFSKDHHKTKTVAESKTQSVDILLKPELNNEPIPQQLTPLLQRQRRKKRAYKRGH